MRAVSLILLLAVFCFFAACSSPNAATPQSAQHAPTPTPNITTTAESKRIADGEEKPDSDTASTEADDENGDAESEDADDDSDSGEYFHGYPCKKDCSGHEAGYRWAEEHDIHDPDRCGGKSQSFIEGCRAWAEENP